MWDDLITPILFSQFLSTSLLCLALVGPPPTKGRSVQLSMAASAPRSERHDLHANSATMLAAAFIPSALHAQKVSASRRSPRWCCAVVCQLHQATQHGSSSLPAQFWHKNLSQKRCIDMTAHAMQLASAAVSLRQRLHLGTVKELAPGGRPMMACPGIRTLCASMGHLHPACTCSLLDNLTNITTKSKTSDWIGSIQLEITRAFKSFHMFYPG